jgi:hypothetical protein
MDKLKVFIRPIWFIALLLTLVFFFHRSYLKSSNVDETAFACDSFGYLTMAKVLRSAQSTAPEYAIETPQARLLIHEFESRNLPLSSWDEFVAPHAHHFQPLNEKIMPQYPPGTGRVLSIFPEKQAVRDINIVTAWSLFLSAIAILAYCFFSNATIAGSFFTIAFVLGLELLRGIGTNSFSINASLIPVLLGAFCVFLGTASFRKTRSMQGIALALVSGICFGFCIQIRIASALLLPGFLILMIRNKQAVFACLTGVFLGGILPLALHQNRVAGAWYLSTYNRGDAAPPSVRAILSNLDFYLGAGPGARYNWAVWVLSLGLAPMMFAYRRKLRSMREVLQIGIGVLSIWLASVLFFLTHSVTAFYYIALPSFACALAISFVVLMFEQDLKPRVSGATKPRALLFFSILAVMGCAAIGMRRELLPEARGPNWPTVIPEELRSPKAWIWADLTSGSFWYYGSRPAFKASFASSDIREIASHFISERNERLYLVLDSPEMTSIAADLEKRGIRLIQKGEVFGQSYVEAEIRK